MEALRPKLAEPFPKMDRYIRDEATGLMIPKTEQENVEWRSDLLQRANADILLQHDLMAACKESYLFWFNAFVWTFHQWDVDPDTGKVKPAENTHVPFVTWEIQDDILRQLYDSTVNPCDILVRKSRDMGASWLCLGMLHWFWLFKSGRQMLELSRTEPYVDQAGNMKALFQKHDYLNKWLPEWMCPPECKPGQRNRTKMHLFNELNGSCIDGESTTEHAASGDRRFIVLLDEFAKVKNGQAIRSATADVTPTRWVNSTPAGPGTEYAKWGNSGQIKVMVLPWWEHPAKGKGRNVKQDQVTGAYSITSPWREEESKRRSPREMAQEIDMEDVQSGDVFFTIPNIEKHQAIFGREPRTYWKIELKNTVSDSVIPDIIRRKQMDSVIFKRTAKGPLRVWANLIGLRPDQAKTYVFGIDISKGQGASNSVVSIRCRETGEKVAEWADANTPPYEMARIVVALALWFGGRRLPFLKWEKNGPGWDFGREIVKKFNYPYYYRTKSVGGTTEKETDKYGWHSSREGKQLLLSVYDRMLAHGGYINPSLEALEEAKMYIYYEGGGIGPANLVNENASATKTHGDRVMADALTLEEGKLPRDKHEGPVAPEKSAAWRKQALAQKRKKMKKRFDFR